MSKRQTILAALMCLLAAADACAAKAKIETLEHIVVVYLENHSFDNVFGLFPGANGLSQARQAPPQIDAFGWPYASLPPVSDGKQADARFPAELANQAFAIDAYVPLDAKTPDPTHRFFIHQMQIDAGRNDRFAQLSSAGALSMGYYDLSHTALWQYAKQYTLADNFFQAAYGGSFLNHQWLICACTPRYPDAPPELRQWRIDSATGRLIGDPSVTADGYAVGSIQPHFPPYDPKRTDNRLPPQTAATIGDRLSAKNISWAWYAGGWRDALAGQDKGQDFQYHHQPFVYYVNYAPDTQARAEHLKDAADFLADWASNPPQVSFYKPVGAVNQHPGYSDISAADHEVAQIVEALQKSPHWPHTAIIVTYDEYGGFWDHVAPPRIDRWGPGSRVPAVIISPLAKKGHIDHHQYDTTSILKLLETRFGLEPLTDRDAAADGFSGAFEFK